MSTRQQRREQERQRRAQKAQRKAKNRRRRKKQLRRIKLLKQVVLTQTQLESTEQSDWNKLIENPWQHDINEVVIPLYKAIEAFIFQYIFASPESVANLQRTVSVLFDKLLKTQELFLIPVSNAEFVNELESPDIDNLADLTCAFLNKLEEKAETVINWDWVTFANGLNSQSSGKVIVLVNDFDASPLHMQKLQQLSQSLRFLGRYRSLAPTIPKFVFTIRTGTISPDQIFDFQHSWSVELPPNAPYDENEDKDNEADDDEEMDLADTEEEEQEEEQEQDEDEKKSTTSEQPTEPVVYGPQQLTLPELLPYSITTPAPEPEPEPEPKPKREPKPEPEPELEPIVSQITEPEPKNADQKRQELETLKPFVLDNHQYDTNASLWERFDTNLQNVDVRVVTGSEEDLLNLEQTLVVLYDKFAAEPNPKLLIDVSTENFAEWLRSQGSISRIKSHVILSLFRAIQSEQTAFHTDYRQFKADYYNNCVIIVNDFEANMDNISRLQNIEMDEQINMILTVLSGKISPNDLPNNATLVQLESTVQFDELFNSFWFQYYGYFNLKQFVCIILGHLFTFSALKDTKGLRDLFLLEYVYLLLLIMVVVPLSKSNYFYVYNCHNMWLGVVLVHTIYRIKQHTKSTQSITAILMGICFILAANAVHILNNGWTMDMIIYCVFGAVVHIFGLLWLKRRT